MLSASCRMTDRPVLVALKANFSGHCELVSNCSDTLKIKIKYIPEYCISMTDIVLFYVDAFFSYSLQKIMLFLG